MNLRNIQTVKRKLSQQLREQPRSVNSRSDRNHSMISYSKINRDASFAALNDEKIRKVAFTVTPVADVAREYGDTKLLQSRLRGYGDTGPSFVYNPHRFRCTVYGH